MVLAAAVVVVVSVMTRNENSTLSQTLIFDADIS